LIAKSDKILMDGTKIGQQTEGAYLRSEIPTEWARRCCHKAKSEIRISSAPKVQTIAAPEGKSHQKERNNPAMPPKSAMKQPMSKRFAVLCARLIPQTAGTIK
jgi:hypothetical protein